MNVIRTTAAGTLEGSYGGIETQRTKPSSFYLPPRASSTRPSGGIMAAIRWSALAALACPGSILNEVTFSTAKAASLTCHKPITSQIDILFAFNNSSTPYQKPPVELLPAPRKAPKADPTNAVLNATHPYAIPQKRVYGAGFSLTIRLILLSYAARSFLKRL
jgi:hypothetical protein